MVGLLDGWFMVAGLICGYCKLGLIYFGVTGACWGLCDDDADLRFASWLLFSLLVWLGDFVVCSVVIALIVLYWCVYCAGFLGVCIFGLIVFFDGLLWFWV